MHFYHTPALLTSLFAMVVAAPVVAQTNEMLELMEARTALQLSGDRISVLERELAKAKAQGSIYSESLAAANDELLVVRESYEKLRVQMEGLGMAAIDPSSTELQSRLLAALSDLRILEQQKRNLAEALMNLTEAVLAASQTASDPAANEAAVEAVERSMSNAEKALATLRVNPEENQTGDLQNASVISLKDDLGIAVLNVGSRQGVHPGMPFSIYRQDKPVARALVVDVRNSVSGAVVQELVNKNDPVKVGDTGRVEAAKG